ncbi:rhodanese-like protein [Dictyocaulus viviparus]|uniref:Rhodanese-like protein n=1 Tax=Dictyocaulus viviparus TaxID=29172 RepID=A0A0D8YA87_DICVI|nr:rhodanese-like protein [Dictyocaulus viviparus]
MKEHTNFAWKKVFIDVPHMLGRWNECQVVNPLPPVPPPAKPTHLAIHNTKKRSSPRWRVIILSTIMSIVFFLLVASILAVFLLGSKATSAIHRQHDEYSLLDSSPLSTSPSSRKYEYDISANHLLTLLITKRKVCLLEASTGDEITSKQLYLAEHIKGARILYHSNLSHSGVPVHPLQFQRSVKCNKGDTQLLFTTLFYGQKSRYGAIDYITAMTIQNTRPPDYTRLLGIDNDCHVIIYDRGQMIWSTYAAWIFKLFGHRRVSILSGGFLAWKTQQARSSQYQTDNGDNNIGLQGNLLSSWNESLVITFDDVLLNTETHTFDLVDAQTKEEYAGESMGVLYGHIYGAVNIPVDTIYDWKSNSWRPLNEIEQVFIKAGLTRQKPVIVYCSTSLRSSLVWWMLKQLNYEARIYFGGWPEWVVRSPDELKVLGRNVGQ